MKPISIPPATVEAHGAVPVTVSAPVEFEFSNGERPEPFEAMRIGDVIYTLIGLENQEEVEALNRTHCFYLGFFSGNIPIFNMRVADILYGPTGRFPVQEELPDIVDNHELHQEARDSWPTIANGDIAYKSVVVKSRFIQKIGTDEQHRDIFSNAVVEPGSYILHSFLLGKTIIITEEWFDFLYESRKASEQNLSDPGEEPERIHKEIPDV